MSLPPPQKAKSRLTHPVLEKTVSPQGDTGILTTAKLRTATLPQAPEVAVRHAHKSSRHRRFLPLLILGIISYAVVGYILNTVYPDQIANVVFYKSYIPIVGTVFLGNFFIASFIFLHSGRGFLSALALTLLFFLKLQDVVLTLPVVATILATATVSILVFTFKFKE